MPVPSQNATVGTVNGGSASTLTVYVTRQSNGATGTFGINFTTPGFPPERRNARGHLRDRRLRQPLSVILVLRAHSSRRTS